MRSLPFTAVLCTLLVAWQTGLAQSAPAPWPDKSITLITPAPPGGAIDLIARTTGGNLSLRLGQPVIVDSRPGADGIIAAQAFLGASDVDHTFLVTFGGLLVNNPVSYPKLPYDAERDFVPVSMLAQDTIVICVADKLQASDMAGLVRLLREHSDEIRWASASGEPRLRFSGFLKQVDTRLVYVPYKALSQAVIDVMAGRIEILVAPMALVLPQAHTGRLKLLATMAMQRSPAAPSVPTVAESGYPQLVMMPFIGLFARVGIRSEIVARLNHEINLIFSDPATARRLQDAGLTPATGTPEGLGAVVVNKLQENRDLDRLVGPGWR